MRLTGLRRKKYAFNPSCLSHSFYATTFGKSSFNHEAPPVDPSQTSEKLYLAIAHGGATVLKAESK